MPTLLTLENASLVKAADPVAPLINPAVTTKAEADPNDQAVFSIDPQDPGFKNLILIGLVVMAWKLWRK